MTEQEFSEAFRALTGNPPFPWQVALFKRFAVGDFPESCNLPTGLGKTSVVAIWLIALATAPSEWRLPRRLVYVVNRRTVVDQTTTEVERLREKLPTVPAVADPLRSLCAMVPDGPKWSPLAISTLRGQFADNREWSADPARPAVIVGTVDMIGSRLLFSGYGVGFKGKPLHAGFLGQDALLVHDEAHLEPAFQRLIEAIRDEQKRCKEFGTFRVMELTATTRGDGSSFGLTPEEKAIPEQLPAKPSKPIHYVWQRMKSKKGVRFWPAKRDAVATTIGKMALERGKEPGPSILIFVRTIDDVKEVKAVLTDKKKGGVAEEQVRLLTGTMRGRERDELATTDAAFARFSPSPKVPQAQGTVYLVCTSAGEVGVDISADYMVCDLSTLDSMTQRFGRVNRRGEGAAMIDVIYETDPNPKPPSPAFEAARWKAKELLERLPLCSWKDAEGRYDASPQQLGELFTDEDEVRHKEKQAERDAAFAPPPVILPVSDILFDAWSLTTIRDRLPGRPKVEPYLHGITDWQLPETKVAWRKEVERLQPTYESDDDREAREGEDRKALAKLAEALLDDFPLKPHELLQDRMTRVRKTLDVVAQKYPNAPAWVVDEDDKIFVTTLGELTEKRNGKSEYVIDSRYCTILLPPTVGGPNAQGMLDEKATGPTGDVSCEWYADKEKAKPRRARSDDDDPPEGMRLVRRVALPGGGEDSDPQVWYWFVRAIDADDDGSKTAREPIAWQHHTTDVENGAKRLADMLLADRADLHVAVVIAARFHDLGKKRIVWQRSIGNPNPKDWHAKSGKDPKTKKIWRPIELTVYRHEFGSLIDIQHEPDFQNLDDNGKDLVLHLIAAHHGRGRPHFPRDEVFDPNHPQEVADDTAMSVPRRFARLQRKYGRWGLAYLESLLRAADILASQRAEGGQS